MTVHNWFPPRNCAPKKESKRFLLEYLRDQKSAGFIADGMKAEGDALIKFLSRTVEERPAREVSAAEPDELLDSAVIHRLGDLFRASRRNGRPVVTDLFRNGDHNDGADWSYFLVFRYSTNRGELLKSFLVIQSPDAEFNGYGFNHFVWGGAKKGQNRYVFRECEGAVLTLEKAYYFVGYNYVIGADKRAADPAVFENARVKAKAHPNGMGLLAAEYEEITRNCGLFSGVAMTLAAAHQPIISRLAFLHLGTKTSLGFDISDRDMQPRELSPKELVGDLKKTVKELRRRGGRVLGIQLQEAIAEKNWEKSGAEALAQKILGMIDNTPDWERSKDQAERSKRQGGRAIRAARVKRVAEGAIETFGPNRPRE
ncbi:hypothetical protein RPPS3_34110 [Rhodopseudomonas palustris]|nr:hypothetical protein RPPS3_34110 [Rhodopseudomonas palustris]